MASLVSDDILKQALAVQNDAHRAWAYSKRELEDGGLTMTVLGCGAMGIAMLTGVLDWLKNQNATSAPTFEPKPKRLPSKFIACVRSTNGAARVRTALDRYNARLKVVINDNVQAVRDAYIVLLACEAPGVGSILQADGIREALAGKMLISICAGWTEEQLRSLIYGTVAADAQKCSIIRAMPNTAAAIQESMTAISISDVPLSAEQNLLVSWIFSRIGRISRVPASHMDACTALCGGGTAFAAVMVESMAAGAIAMGISRDQAYEMAAQTVRGATGVLLRGEHPALLRDQVSTPGGVTTTGLSVLEEGGFRGTVAKAIRDASKKAAS